MSDHALDIGDVAYRYDALEALRGVSLQVAPACSVPAPAATGASA